MKNNMNTIPPVSNGNPSHPSQPDWISIGIFLLLAFGLSWAAFIGLRALGLPLVVYAATGMFGPALAALFTRLIRHQGFADAGLRLVERGKRGRGWMYLVAYLFPPLITAASIGFVLATGYQHWNFQENVQQLGQLSIEALQAQGQPVPQGMAAEQIGQTNFLIGLAMSLSLAPIINSFFAFGEEFGWRGYLFPKLLPLGAIPTVLISNAIWGLWHAPLIVLDGYNYPGHPWLGVLMMIVFCIALGTILSWLRLRSGSVWPAALAHGAINAQVGLGATLLSQGDSLLGAPIGLLALIPTIILALILIVTGQLKYDQPVITEESNTL